jgi:hypothetical protein
VHVSFMMDQVALGHVGLLARQIASPLPTARIVTKQIRSFGVVVTWMNV